MLKLPRTAPDDHPAGSRPWRAISRLGLGLVLALVVVIGATRSGKEDRATVVVYSALDRAFSEPVFERFTAATGIEVLARYDVESTKTVGLVNRLRHEAARPVCDVFWNNEPVHTIRLAGEGLLVATTLENAAGIPLRWRDESARWTGFAARARVLLVNTDRVAMDERPTSILDLAAPRFRGRAAIAKPLFGTTASHMAILVAAWGEARTAAWLDGLRENEVQIHGGNRPCAEAVSAGLADVGLTDTDDAIGELRTGAPVAIVYPDQDVEGMGTVFFPNTVSMVRGAPHPEAAVQLMEYLLSAEVEEALAAAAASQVPLRAGVRGPVDVLGPGVVRAEETGFARAAAVFDVAAGLVLERLLD